ncbi:MAG: PelD GGDEF domain-containing protein [Chitinivorax sp.]
MKNELLQKLAPHRHPAWVWLETVALTSIAIGSGVLLQANDPLFIHSEFPWTWFAPMLLALRYGALPGVASAAMILFAWLAALRLGLTSEAAFPKLYFLGGLLLTLLCGEYSGLWRTRVRRIQEVNRYIDHRLEDLTQRLYLQRLSHDRLEQSLINKPVTLRDALLKLRVFVLERAQQNETLPAAQEFLSFLSQFCQLEVAALHPMQSRKHPLAQPVASIGGASELQPDDPLLQFALENQMLSHVQHLEGDLAQASRYLLVAPIKTSLSQTRGLLVVERMPFFALNEETLQTLTVLIAYYADHLIAADAAIPMREMLPDCPELFAEEVLKLARIEKETGIPSHIVALSVGRSGRQKDIYAMIKRMQRTLDLVWEMEEGEIKIMLTLMPLAGQQAVDGYLARIEAALQDQFGVDFVGARIKPHHSSVGVGHAPLLVQDIVTTCRINK